MFSWGRPPILRYSLFIFVITTSFGCVGQRGDSSDSIRQSRSRGVFIAEYVVPRDMKLGPYRPIEIWVEKSRSGVHELVVRLDGPHHGGGDEFRVRIADFKRENFRGRWSYRDGPPYERWLAPAPLPHTLLLERDEKTVEVRLKSL